MGRNRTMFTTVNRPVTIGYTYLDLVYPYGDGPWTNATAQLSAIGPPFRDFDKICADELHPGPPYLTGGDLGIYEYHSDQYVVKAPVDVINWLFRYTGGHLPSFSPDAFLSWPGAESFKLADPGNVSAHGATGWNLFRPTRPAADLAVFLGEFQDVPRTLRDTAKGFHNMWRAAGGSKTGFTPKSVAGHWLTTQFGWLPFLSDLRRFYKATKNLDVRLKRLRRNNGKWERRGGTFITDSSSATPLDETNTIGLLPAVPTYLYQTPFAGYRRVVTSVTQRVWFEAAFKYWIPGNPDSPAWTRAARRMIYGAQPGPSLIWELTPWSWLIDWWSNVGDIIANVQSTLFDNLTAKYAYVMGTTEYKSTFSGSSVYVDQTAHGTWTSALVQKSRVAASPFGFGLSGDDFSTRQWSILSALGINKLGVK